MDRRPDRAADPAAPRPRRSPGHDGILGGPIDLDPRRGPAFASVAAKPGLRITHRATGVAGTVVRCAGGVVTMRTDGGHTRNVRSTAGGFTVEGRAVTLVDPPVVRRDPAAGPDRGVRTASGSVAVANAPAQVAKASRIWVEGIHDAALIERVWGDDLRVEGIVVEQLEGADHLAALVEEFRPGPSRRLGILVDHLVEGSKEWRIARSVAGPHVLVTGTPYVDVWQAVKPGRVGLERWPVVPRGTPWKEGICAALGETDPAQAWRRILGSVRSFVDLEPPLVGAVERLIDFVAAGEQP